AARFMNRTSLSPGAMWNAGVAAATSENDEPFILTRSATVSEPDQVSLMCMFVRLIRTRQRYVLSMAGTCALFGVALPVLCPTCTPEALRKVALRCTGADFASMYSSGVKPVVVMLAATGRGRIKALAGMAPLAVPP